MIRSAHRWVCAASLLGSVLAGSPAWAQSSSDVFIVAIPTREDTEVEADLMAADNDFLDARNAENLATAARTEAQVSIQSKRLEIEDAKKRREAAKSSGNETEATTIDVQRRALERERELLEQRATLRAAEIDLARQKGELATLVKRSLEFERSLMQRRRELAAAPAGTPAASSLQRIILDLEQQTLNARVREADKRIDVASRERRVASSLLKLIDAQRRMMIAG